MSDGNDPSRGPDGRFVGSNPSPQPATSGEAPASAPATASETNANPAPDTAHRANARKEFERLTAQQDKPADGAGTTHATQPATRETNPAAPAAPAQPAQAAGAGDTAAKAEDKSPPAEAKPYAEYDGIDRKTGDLLKSVGMLVPADQWKGMSRWEQDEHVAACKQMRRQQAQQFQQNKQQGDPSGQQQQTFDPGARGEQPGFPGQQQQPAPAGQLPRDVQESLAQLATDFGVDSPAYQAQLRLATHLQNALQQVQTTHQGSLRAIEKASQDLQTRRFEDSVLDKYREAAPKFFADPKSEEEVRQVARNFFDVRLRNGEFNGMEPAAVQQEARSIITRAFLSSAAGSEIHQRETERLAKAKTDSLAGSVERGSPVAAKRPQPLTPKQRAKEQYDKLQGLAAQGIEGDAALQHVA